MVKENIHRVPQVCDKGPTIGENVLGQRVSIAHEITGDLWILQRFYTDFIQILYRFTVEIYLARSLRQSFHHFALWLVHYEIHYASIPILVIACQPLVVYFQVDSHNITRVQLGSISLASWHACTCHLTNLEHAVRDILYWSILITL